VLQNEGQITSFKNRIDEHYIMTFYYKFASLYFGIGDNEKCIDYLNKIISNQSLSMREDLLCFSRWWLIMRQDMIII